VFNLPLIPLANSFAPLITLSLSTCQNAYTRSRNSCITPHPHTAWLVLVEA